MTALAVALAGPAVSCGAAQHRATGRTPAGTTAAQTAPTAVPTTAAATTVAPTTTTTTTTPPPPPTTKAPAVVSGTGIAVGDSVLEDVRLYAASTLTSHDIAINAAVGRQWAVGVGILSSMKASGKLPPVVVVGLGSNGRITASQFDQMMQVCSGAKRVVFMTVTGPLIGNNPVIRDGVARYPQAALADWNIVAASHPDWFAPDKVHVGPAGAAALGNLLASVS